MHLEVQRIATVHEFQGKKEIILVIPLVKVARMSISEVLVVDEQR